MRILYVIPAVQHPTMRGALRHYHFVRALSRRHTITLLALSKSPITREAREEIEPWVEQLLTFEPQAAEKSAAPGGSILGLSFAQRWQRHQQIYSAIRRMKAAFAELLRSRPYDLVLFHGKEVFPVIEGLHGMPLVVDFCDASSARLLGALAHSSPAEFPRRLVRYAEFRWVEAKILQKTRHVAFISNRDREAVLGRQSKARVIPNGVDLRLWTRTRAERHPAHLFFSGVLDYSPNDDAARFLVEKVVPLVQRSVPNLQVTIAGMGASPALRAAAERHPCVRLAGYLPRLQPALEQATVFAAPLRFASGTQNKVLEAMAMELPVVTTGVVADGLRVDGAPGVPVVVADDAAGFAKAVMELLADQSRQQRLAREGRSFVQAHFDWERSAELLEQMCWCAVAQHWHRSPWLAPEEWAQWPAPWIAAAGARPAPVHLRSNKEMHAAKR